MKLRGKALFIGGTSTVVGIFLAMLFAGWFCSMTSRADEPSPPDLLDVIVQNTDAAAGTLTFETVVKSALDATAELAIDDPAGTVRLNSGGRRPYETIQLRKGGEQSRE